MSNQARSRPPAARWTVALAIGALAGYACTLLHTPIPWMLGPLFALAFVRIGGMDIEAPPAARYLGQWVIGTALGLYFTPQVMREVGGLWHLLAAAAAFAIGVGYLSALVLAWLGGLDRTTAFFASVPGGATEMAVLGERFGARGDRVAAAQSLRILIVVGILPAAITALGVHGTDPYVQGAKTFDATGLAILMTATGLGGLLLQRLRVPNAFILGALMVAISLTAVKIDLSTMPSGLSNAGQCLLGCALGSRFQSDFLRGAHRFVGAVVLTVVLSMALSAAFGVALAWMTALPPVTMVLGTAPGGIAEMCVTAKVLQLGVPLVTAFHVTRLVVLLLGTAPLFVRVRAWRKRNRGARG